MFKERLIITGKKVGHGLLQVFLMVLMFALMIGLVVLVSEYPTLEMIVRYTVYSMIGLVALIFLVAGIVGTFIFIQWLFVEPYKERKRIKS